MIYAIAAAVIVTVALMLPLAIRDLRRGLRAAKLYRAVNHE